MLSHLNSQPQAPERLVVLGANGFVARHLREWCEASGIPCLAVSSAEVDLSKTSEASRLAALLQPGDAVVMTSALTPERGRDYLTLMHNLRMAESVCLALEQTPCTHFVYLSSDAVYKAHKLPLDEGSVREPTSLYALCHTAREMILGSELERLQIPYCILRLSAIYGPGDTHDAYGPNRFVRSALKHGRIVLFGKGEEKRSHVFIDDVIYLIGLTLTHRSIGILNISDCPSRSFAEMARIVAELTACSVSIDEVPRNTPVIHKPFKPTQPFRFVHNLGNPVEAIVHRTFANSAIFSAFPDFRFTPHETGLARLVYAERLILT